jgi:hypothetical protein
LYVERERRIAGDRKTEGARGRGPTVDPDEGDDLVISVMNSHGAQSNPRFRVRFGALSNRLNESPKRVVQAVGSEQRLLIVSVGQSQQKRPSRWSPGFRSPDEEPSAVALVAVRFRLGEFRAYFDKVRAVRDVNASKFVNEGIRQVRVRSW